MGPLVPRRVHHLEVAVGAQRDSVAVLDRGGRRFDHREEIGSRLDPTQLVDLMPRGTVSAARSTPVVTKWRGSL